MAISNSGACRSPIPVDAWDDSAWRPARYRRFLLPVRVLSRRFRANCRAALQHLDGFQSIPSAVWRQEWVVHCQPVGQGEPALRYLAPYIFRVAISNSRLVSLADNRVTFRYRPSGTRRRRLCTLVAGEFIRRFVQHVLPRGFVKVRYYGFFSPGQRSRLRQVRAALISPTNHDEPTSEQSDATNPASNPLRRCPVCGYPLRRVQPLPPQSPCPPWQTLTPQAHSP